MHSLRLGCKNSCQSLLVHPKFILDVSTKCHTFHLSPTPLPGNGNFSSGLDLENLNLTFENWPSPTLAPSRNGHFSSGLDLENLQLTFENWLSPTPTPFRNGHFSSGLDLENLKLTFEN